MIQVKRYGARLVILISMLSPSLFSTHNVNRYFPFFERSEIYRYHKKPYINASLFVTTASTAFIRDGVNTGVPELWGNYDLQDLFTSLVTE